MYVRTMAKGKSANGDVGVSTDGRKFDVSTDASNLFPEKEKA